MTENRDEILEAYSPLIRRIAVSYMPPGPRREDLEQDIAVAVLKAVPSFRGEASMKTYIYRIAQNCGVDALKRQYSDHDEFDGRRHGTRKRTPEQTTLERERQERLADAIRQLPLSLRQPLVLRLEGLAYDEIAEILKLTTSNVGVRIHRAKAALKSKLGGTS